MQEYYTPGIVLDREPRNELDEAVTIFTKDLGKVRAFTKSSRKITSKLSGHLSPGRLANVRFVERNKLQLVDVLSSPASSPAGELLPFLNFISKITPYGDADLSLWYTVEEIVRGNHLGPSVYRHLVERLGYSDEDALCHYCKNVRSSFFNLPEMTLFCANCQGRLNLKSDELVFLGEN